MSAIGIDLGTTHTIVAYFDKKTKNAVVIADPETGNRLIPSIVAYPSNNVNDVIIGEEAKHFRNQEYILFDTKRFIGKNYDKLSELDAKQTGLNIVETKYGVSFQLPNNIQVSPIDVATNIIKKAKQIAETYLNQKVYQCVITVPAYFGDKERDATRAACIMADIEPIRIINEPTAASLAYGLNDNCTNETVLVYDMGGGTLDVTLLQIDGDTDQIYKVIGTNGNTRLGGEDFDTQCGVWLLTEFSKKYPNVSKKEYLGNQRVWKKVRKAVEQAKCDLSYNKSTIVFVESLYDGIDFTINLTRAKWEDICNKLFQKAMQPVINLLQDCDKKPSEISSIVCVGGSTRLPKIQQLLKNLFNKDPLCTLNPDFAVGEGAAIHAANLTGHLDEIGKSIVLVDVTPLSIGIKTAEGLMQTLIKRNTSLPASNSKWFTVTTAAQRYLKLEVYQGERTLATNNVLLGELELYDLPPAEYGELKIEVGVDINVNGLIEVWARIGENTRNKKIKAVMNRCDNEHICNQLTYIEENQNKESNLMDEINTTQKLANLYNNYCCLVAEGTISIEQQNDKDTYINPIKIRKVLNGKYDKEIFTDYITKLTDILESTYRKCLH